MKIKIRADFEKARSIRKIALKRKDFVEEYGDKIFSSIVCENYYEIIKELSNAIFLTKGFRFVGSYAHKEMFEEIVKVVGLDDSWLVFLDDFRNRRNGSLYYGESFEKVYLDNYLDKIDFVIKKVLNFLDDILEGEK